MFLTAIWQKSDMLGASTPRYHGNDSMYAIDYVIYSLWVVFWVGWLIAGARAKRAAQSRMGQFVGLRLATLVILYFLYRFGVLKGHHAVVSSPVLQGVGMALFLIGLGLAVWARVHLGRNWGTPMSEKVDAELVTSGPYRYVRNPIYSGIILAAIGTTVAVSWYWLAAVVLMGAYFVYSATVEEHTMERLFPNAYPAYKRSTKKLIPFIF
jgi:protein-S-isoprenylcysteine O-methyltransferase Ste14